MKNRIRAIVIAAALLVFTGFTLFGCVPPAPILKTNYLFKTADLVEQQLKSGEHINIFATALGGFIEGEIFANKGKLDYSGAMPFVAVDEKYNLDVKLTYDCNAAPVGGLNLSLGFQLKINKPDGGFVSNINLIGDKFSVEIMKNGEPASFANAPSLLQSFFQLTPNGVVKQLSLIFSFVSWESESIRFGTKMHGGKEISELLLCVNVYSSLQSILRAMIANYGLDHDKEGVNFIKGRLNELTRFLFGKDYDKLSEMPLLYLNADVIMRDKVITAAEIGFGTAPAYIKVLVAGE